MTLINFGAIPYLDQIKLLKKKMEPEKFNHINEMK